MLAARVIDDDRHAPPLALRRSALANTIWLMTKQERPSETELRSRILSELRHHGGSLPSIVNATWRGYLAACIEWGLVEPEAHRRLVEVLPPLGDDASVGILLGRDES